METENCKEAFENKGVQENGLNHRKLDTDHWKSDSHKRIDRFRELY